MVTVTDYKLRESLEGKTFFALILQGGVELVRSANGGSYLTAKKASLPTTFDEVTCQTLVGTQLPGSIQKVETAAYDYTIPETGEVITLTHRYEYQEHEEMAPAVDFTKLYNHSGNGVSRPAAV